jgi:hypothetical protein
MASQQMITLTQREKGTYLDADGTPYDGLWAVRKRYIIRGTHDDEVTMGVART